MKRKRKRHGVELTPQVLKGMFGFFAQQFRDDFEDRSMWARLDPRPAHVGLSRKRKREERLQKRRPQLIPVLPGSVTILTNRLLQPEALFLQADGLTEAECAHIKAVEDEAKRRGDDHRLARVMATIETGKVRTIHCGTKAAADLAAWAGAGGGRS